jgi:hypothetical protein
MTSISLKDEVAKALAAEWESFRSRHPRLAAVIDQTLLTEQAVACIADDPAFRAALEKAGALASGASIVEEAVRRSVGEWFERLFGASRTDT